MSLQEAAREISTHTPLAGRDLYSLGISASMTISTHTPLAGRDSADVGLSHRHDHFNSHAPCGARLPATFAMALQFDFNSHAPCGARRQNIVYFAVAPSKSRGGLEFWLFCFFNFACNMMYFLANFPTLFASPQVRLYTFHLHHLQPLKDNHAFRVISLLCADMLHALLPVVPEVIKSQAILRRVNQFD